MSQKGGVGGGPAIWEKFPKKKPFFWTSPLMQHAKASFNHLMPTLGETDLLCSPLPPLAISNGGWLESCRGKHDFPIKQWGLEMFPFSAAALLLQNHFCHNTYTIYAMD